MGNIIQLTASDGHTFDVYRADADAPKGGLVIIQEIFGVNAHIRELCVQGRVAHIFGVCGNRGRK